MSIILAQSSTLRPLMQKLALLTAITRRAGKYQIAWIIRSAFSEWYHMVDVVRPRRFCELRLAVVTPIVLPFELTSDVLWGKGPASLLFLRSTLMLPCLTFILVCFAINFCSFKYCIPIAFILSSITVAHMFLVGSSEHTLFLTQRFLVVFPESFLTYAYLFFVFLVTPFDVFFVCVIIYFTLSSHAFLTRRGESTFDTTIFIKELKRGMEYILAFGAALSPFREYLSRMVCLQIFFIALFASIIQTISISLVSNEEFRSSRFVLLASIALLELWGILGYDVIHNGSHLSVITPPDVSSIVGAKTYLCKYYSISLPQKQDYPTKNANIPPCVVEVTV